MRSVPWTFINIDVSVANILNYCIVHIDRIVRISTMKLNIRRQRRRSKHYSYLLDEH